MTCITSDFEVVYAGAFISKVGHYNRAQVDRFGGYTQVAVLKAEQESLSARLKALGLQRDQIDQEDVQAHRKVQRAEAAVVQLRQQTSKLQAQEFEHKAQIARKQNALAEAGTLERQLKQRQADLTA